MKKLLYISCLLVLPLDAMEEVVKKRKLSIHEGGRVELIESEISLSDIDQTSIDCQLINAVKSQKSAWVKKSLELGADANALDEHGIPALMLAVHQEEETEHMLAICDLLLEAGADVESWGQAFEEPDWQLPLIATVEKKFHRVATLLMQKGTFKKTNSDSLNGGLLEALENSDKEKAKKLIALGAQCTINEWGDPLLEAVQRGRYSFLELLIKNGADVNAKDREFPIILVLTDWDDETPVDFGQRIEACKILLKAGADINAIEVDENGEEGHSALTNALKRKNNRIVRFLLEWGARPSHPNYSVLELALRVFNRYGMSNVKQSVEKADEDLLQLLLWYYADPREESNECYERKLENGGYAKIMLSPGNPNRRQILKYNLHMPLSKRDSTLFALRNREIGL